MKRAKKMSQAAWEHKGGGLLGFGCPRGQVGEDEVSRYEGTRESHCKIWGCGGNGGSHPVSESSASGCAVTWALQIQELTDCGSGS